MMKVVKDPQIEVEIPSHFHKVPSKQHQSQGKQQPLAGQALGLRQARLEHLQSHHNSSLLFGAKSPKPQLGLHFFKSAALVVVGLEFFFGFAWLEAVENRICCRSKIFGKKHC